MHIGYETKHCMLSFSVVALDPCKRWQMTRGCRSQMGNICACPDASSRVPFTFTLQSWSQCRVCDFEQIIIYIYIYILPDRPVESVLSPSSYSVCSSVPTSSILPSCPAVVVVVLCPSARPVVGRRASSVRPHPSVRPVAVVRLLSVRPVVRLIITYMTSVAYCSFSIS